MIKLGGATFEYVNIRKYRKMLWVILVLSPFWAGLIIGMVSETSIFHMDAWNTTWNDEVGYYRAVVTMRTIGLPKGLSGYNELASKYPSFGAYNYFTYIPYVAMSFLTGTSSHNFIVYANVFMMAIAWLFLVVLLKPSIRQTIWLILFECLDLILVRYIWSGMSEVNSIFMTVIICTCFLYMHKEHHLSPKVKRILIFQISCILFYGIIRPFLLSYILLPVYCIIAMGKSKRKRAVALLMIGMALVISVLLYFFMQENCCAKYFFDNESVVFFHILRNGDIVSFITFIADTNYEAFVSILEQVMRLEWGGFVTTSAASSIAVMFIASMLHKKVGYPKIKVICVFMVTVALMYEANVLLYSAKQLHRMMLAPATAGAILCCMIFEDKVCCVRQLLVSTALFMGILFMGKGEDFSIPQENHDITYQSGESMKKELAMLMPDKNSKNKWDLSFANLPQSGNLQLFFSLPAYLSGSTCTGDYLHMAIDRNELKSKYILVQEHNDDLIKKCTAKYHFVWKGCGFLIYSQKRE